MQRCHSELLERAAQFSGAGTAATNTNSSGNNSSNNNTASITAIPVVDVHFDADDAALDAGAGGALASAAMHNGAAKPSSRAAGATEAGIPSVGGRRRTPASTGVDTSAAAAAANATADPSIAHAARSIRSLADAAVEFDARAAARGDWPAVDVPRQLRRGRAPFHQVLWQTPEMRNLCTALRGLTADCAAAAAAISAAESFGLSAEDEGRAEEAAKAAYLPRIELAFRQPPAASREVAGRGRGLALSSSPSSSSSSSSSSSPSSSSSSSSSPSSPSVSTTSSPLGVTREEVCAVSYTMLCDVSFRRHSLSSLPPPPQLVLRLVAAADGHLGAVALSDIEDFCAGLWAEACKAEAQAVGGGKGEGEEEQDNAFDPQVLRALSEIAMGEGELDAARAASNALHGAVEGQAAGGAFAAEGADAGHAGRAHGDEIEAAARSRRHAVVSAAVGRFARRFEQQRYEYSRVN